ncbi:MAG: dihydroorotate dehydrogenase [Candidatus Omnitrophota bacterium]|jgi:dihydroorotate dehydrogenase (NAD+) catalytic subunit|nr:MAG: dihydroorotate dehydrogenase [Candidatus Omnitrophota bacterium]
MKTDLRINIGKLKLKNPVMVASGTFGYAEEFEGFMDLSRLGAIVTKTITLKPRKGNPAPRTCETPSGLLNSIGLENPGVDAFIKDKLKYLLSTGAPVIVSIASEKDASEFVELASLLDKVKEISAIELNISCPNIKKESRNQGAEGLSLISQDARATYELVKAVRRKTRKVIITKLSPNVTCISDIARAAESAGSDAISLINTLSGMCININTRRPKIASVTGGLSGPAIRPIAVRMAWEVFNNIKLPIIGMGGIMNTSDALEFIVAGATAVSIGTANFVYPDTAIKIISGLEEYLSKNKIKTVRSIIGGLEV